MSVKTLIVCLGLIATSASLCSAKSWRGIVPLKSNRGDVERLLGASVDQVFAEYRLPGEKVYVDYAPTENWPFPIAKGTVISITVIPRYKLPLESLGVRLSDFKKLRGALDIPENFVYSNSNEGFSIEATNGIVNRLTYLPTRTEYQRRKRRPRR